MYGLSTADVQLQRRAREFADELIPYEQAAEENDGFLPDGVAKEHHERAIALGLYATNMPTSVGGLGCTTLQQVLVQEQAGRGPQPPPRRPAHPPQRGPGGRGRPQDGGLGGPPAGGGRARGQGRRPEQRPCPAARPAD